MKPTLTQSQMSRAIAVACLVLALVFLAGPTLLAQVTTATLYGIVVDPSGGVIPGAAAELTSEGTGAIYRRESDVNGEFGFTFIPAGSYRLRVGSDGFKTLQEVEIGLGAGQNVRRTFQLEVGERHRDHRSYVGYSVSEHRLCGATGEHRHSPDQRVATVAPEHCGGGDLGHRSGAELRRIFSSTALDVEAHRFLLTELTPPRTLSDRRSICSGISTTSAPSALMRSRRCSSSRESYPLSTRAPWAATST